MGEKDRENRRGIKKRHRERHEERERWNGENVIYQTRPTPFHCLMVRI